MAIASRLAPTWVLGRSWGLRSKQIPCGSEPARDSGGSACIDVEWAAVIASRLAPTWVLGCSWGLRSAQIPVGASLLAIAVGQLASMLNPPTAADSSPGSAQPSHALRCCDPSDWVSC
ncbi:hypothetical protein CF597_21925 [Pseudomonas sp. PSB1]|nr:hypothetical protein [Pseudomonas sp. PSB1]